MIRRRWTPVELALIASMYPECHTGDLAAWLERPVGSVYQAAIARGLRKSAEYLASDTACRIRRANQSPNMIASRFQKGQVSWTKGTKGVVGVQEGCRRTQFKKGRKPEDARNYRPIGSLRICADGYLERKVTDDANIAPARRWVAVHRIVWESERGPIPPGFIVRFKPGMLTARLEEITPDRLECISRAEHATRNHPRSRDPELGRLIQLKGAISRQVNRITKETNDRTAHQPTA